VAQAVETAPASPEHDGAAGAAASEEPEPRRLLTGWLIACAAFFLIGAGWALALPVDGTYDESEHLLRAYGAASGQLYTPPAKAARGGGAYVDAPRSLLPDNVHCAWKGEQKRAASCQHTPPDDTTRHRVGTTAGRYNPVYYVPVGIPMVLFPNQTGIILGRLVSSLLSAMLLASAVVVALRMRSRLTVAAVVLCTTPMAANLNGAINPNGIEIAAGVLLWVTLIALLRTPEKVSGERAVRRLLILAAVAASLLLTVRALGPLWLALIAAVALAVARKGRLAELLKRRDTRWLLAGVSAVAVYAVVWFLVSGALSVVPNRGGGHDRIEDMVRIMTTTRASFWTNQIIGQFSYGETTLPSWVIVFWYALIAALVLPAALLARWRDRWALIALGVVSVVALAALEVHYYPTLNWAQHSRYVMPVGVGLVLLAAVVGRYPAALGSDGQSALVRLAVVVTAPLHVFALAMVMTRFGLGPSAPANPFKGDWLPSTGPLLPLLALAAGVALLGWYAWRDPVRQ